MDVNLDQLPTASRTQMRADITELHNELCKNGYPRAVDDAELNRDKAPYKNFFGSARNKVVLKVLNDVKGALQYPKRVINYVFRASDCKKCLCYLWS